MKKVAVIGIPGAWSSEKLADALGQATGFRLLVDLEQVVCDLDRARVDFRGFDLTRLDAAVVKKLGPSDSPRLPDRLEILKYLERRGVRVFSRPDNLGRVLSRLACTLGLSAAGIPMPPTVVTEDPGEAAAAVQRLGRVVLKPLYSSKARGMMIVEAGDHAAERIAAFQSAGNPIIYLQKLIDLPGRDLGLAFLGGKYLAAYAREGRKGEWNTTTASGGRYRAHEPDPDLVVLAERAQKPFGLDFTCVDVAEAENGPVVFEVSAFGGFRGLEAARGIDAARLYADYVLKAIA